MTKEKRPSSQTGAAGNNPEHRYDFAKAMARSVFGRHHFDGEAERRFREAIARKPPKHRNRP